MSTVSSLTKISVEIAGLPPGVMFQGKGLMSLPTPGKPRPPDEEARHRAHWVTVKGKKQMAIPWTMLKMSICKGGAAFKFKGKKSYESILGPTLACETDLIPLGVSDFETFVEWVKIPPRTGACVQIGRPVLREWKCTIPIIADTDIWNPKLLEEIINEAGKNVGIGAWRPQLKGPWGKFRVVNFKIE